MVGSAVAFAAFFAFAVLLLELEDAFAEGSYLLTDLRLRALRLSIALIFILFALLRLAALTFTLRGARLLRLLGAVWAFPLRFFRALAERAFLVRLLAPAKADSPTNLAPFFPILRTFLVRVCIADGGISL